MGGGAVSSIPDYSTHTRSYSSGAAGRHALVILCMFTLHLALFLLLLLLLLLFLLLLLLLLVLLFLLLLLLLLILFAVLTIWRSVDCLHLLLRTHVAFSE